MLKPSLHPFCEIQEDQEVQKTIKNSRPLNLEERDESVYTAPVVPPCLSFTCLRREAAASGSLSLQLCSASEKDHSFVVQALHGNHPPLLLVFAHGARKTFLGGPLTRRF